MSDTKRWVFSVGNDARGMDDMSALQFQEMSEMFADRAAFYRLLSSLFFKEVTEKFLDTLQSQPLPTQDETLFGQGCRELKHYLVRKGPDARTDLAVDYARCFLAAGILEGDAACPYESIYTGEEPLIMQEARDQVRAIYISQGVNVDENLHLPEDHLSFELEFLAIMSDRAQKACLEQNATELQSNIAVQQAFIDEHVLNWLPSLDKNLQAVAREQFYPAILHMTQGYLQLDKDFLDEAKQALALDLASSGK